MTTAVHWVRSIYILDNVQEDWGLHGLAPLTPECGFPANNAHLIERRSPTELLVTNTEGAEILFKVRPAVNS